MVNVGIMNLVIIIWGERKENEQETTQHLGRGSRANADEDGC